LTVLCKLNSITLLAALLLLQYAHHINYLQCRVVNYFQTSSQTCDCNKVFAQEKEPVDNREPLPAHTHFHLDEYYSGAKAAAGLILLQYYSETGYPAYSTLLKAGVKDEIIHPPRYC
jgi:hypothetical protein